jgi:tetratricopeptide (TPR) repeat protein
VAAAQPSAAPADSRGQAYFEFLLARRLEAQGDAAGALEALKRALTLDPKSAELYAELGGYYARQDKASEAVEAAERALTLDANNSEAHRMLGLVFAAWSDGSVPLPPGRTQAQVRSAAIEHLTKILETPAVATDLNLQLTLARLHLRAGNGARAIPILENIVSQAPFATEPYILLAEARLGAGRVDGAIEAMSAAAELNPRYYLSLGDLYERQNKWPEAAGAYERAMATVKGPASRDLRLRYATALLNLPRPDSAAKARDVLKDLLVTAPQDTRGLFLLSTASLRLGDLQGAEGLARKLLDVDPTSTQGLHALSSALVARREYRQVVELLTPVAKNTAGRSRESDAALLAQLAHAHTQLGEHAQAIAVLTAAVARDPLSAPALNSLGYTLADRGERLPEAIGYIERALKVAPTKPSRTCARLPMRCPPIRSFRITTGMCSQDKAAIRRRLSRGSAPWPVTARMSTKVLSRRKSRTHGHANSDADAYGGPTSRPALHDGWCGGSDCLRCPPPASSFWPLDA